MNRLSQLLLIFAVLACSTGSAFAQRSIYNDDPEQKVTVKVKEANLRQEATTKSEIVAKVKEGETFTVLETDGSWYKVETDDAEGWLHKSTVRTDSEDEDSVAAAPVPKTTRKPLSGGDSPFRSTYTGGTEAEIVINNDSEKNMTLKFGGVRYSIPSNSSKSITVAGGNYEFHASAPGVRPATGVRAFNAGYNYSWRFFIQTFRVWR